MMIIEWQKDVSLPQSTLALMEKAADQCLLSEGISLPCAISVRLCDDPAIAVINQRHRGIDRATDVLSFPSVLYPNGKTAGTCLSLLRREFDDETGACFLGDLIISVPHIFSQAQEYGHSPEREAAYLLVHGICHLMGYDHMTEDDRARMRAMEEKVLTSVSAFRSIRGGTNDTIKDQ